MSETLLRPHSVETQISLPPIGTATTKLRAVEAQKETRRQTQKINSSNKNAALKRKAKGNGGDDDGEEEVDEEEEGPVEKGKGKGKEKKEQEPRRKKGDPIPYGVTVSKPNSEVRGHTSYLTVRLVLFPSPSLSLLHPLSSAWPTNDTLIPFLSHLSQSLIPCVAFIQSGVV
jgi:hypothetical protein